MSTLTELIVKKVNYINSATNSMVGSAGWLKLKQLIKIDIKQAGEHETTFKAFQERYKLNKTYSDTMLKEINSDLFR